MDSRSFSSVIEMHESLKQSVDKAGGTPEAVNLKSLESMSALELLGMLCTNNIRFIYLGESNGHNQ